LFADRTFSSFQNMGKGMVGKIGTFGINTCTCWRNDTALEFIGFKGYKVLGCDSKD